MEDSQIDGYINELRDMISKVERDKIQELVRRIKETRIKDNTIFIIGNGGSASTASHWACDLGKGTLKTRYNSNKRLKVISLTDNVATITAYANDLTYDEIFSQQLKNLVKEGDLLIVLTGSGKSKNIINAIEVAKRAKAYVFSLLGFDGGKVKHISDNSIIIPSKNYCVIEDIHLSIGHIITSIIKGEK
jgi:D-sedoheptulose 7-phosphate isomerase